MSSPPEGGFGDATSPKKAPNEVYRSQKYRIKDEAGSDLKGTDEHLSGKKE
jgi:hypothetical protein